MSNNSNNIAGVSGVEIANPKKSLKVQPPRIFLPPFSAVASTYEAPEQLSAPQTSQIATEYKGRKAESVQYEISSPLQLLPNTEYPYPINVWEDGELYHFTVQVNTDKIRIVCICYDDNNKAATIANDTALDLAIKGRGMTHAQAYATDHNKISLDPPGQSHPVMPYLSRSKSTLSYGFTDTDLEKVAGTVDDRHFVIEYAPTVPRPYKKLFFTLQNLSNNTQIIHYCVLQRYKFTDRYEYTVKPTNEILNKKAAIGV